MLKRASHWIKRGCLQTKVRRQFSDSLKAQGSCTSEAHKFELKEEKQFADFDIVLKKYSHEASGLVHYHLATDDSHKCMAFIYRTTADDQAGYARSLERMILCGSDAYPVRDPFAHMTKRSMNSCVDAWTGPDFTSYMFSTTNTQDFFNLLDVYSESLSNPAMKRLDFFSTVWRPEYQSPANPASPLMLRGDQADEIRKLQSDPEVLAIESVYSSLFKGTPLEYSSRGHLTSLAESSLEGLKDYFSKAYHPQNTTIYSYGDVDPAKIHKKLNDRFLSSLNRSINLKKPPSLEEIDPPLSKPAEAIIKIPMTGVGNQVDDSSIVSVSWLCPRIDSNSETILGLNLLSTLLFEMPMSPFYKEFLEAGIAQGYSPGYGYEQNVKNSFFVVGVKGVQKGKEKEVVAKIEEVLQNTVKNKFEKSVVLSLLNQVETQAKLARLNFGLDFLQSHLGVFNTRTDSMLHASLNLRKSINQIRNKVQANHPYFENLIQEYLINNQKQAKVIMETDPYFLDELERKEGDICQKMASSLDDTARSQVCRDALELEEEMKTIQNVDILPQLKLEDFPKKVERTKYTMQKVQQVDTYFFDKSTRGMTYFKMKLDLRSMSHEEVYYLYLASKLFKRVGTFSLKHSQFNALQQFYLAELDFKVFYEGRHEFCDSQHGFGLFTASCLDVNLDKMFDILAAILSEPDFKDLSHLSTLIKHEATEAANRLGTDPLNYAIKYNERKKRGARQFFNEVEGVWVVDSGQIYLQLGNKIKEGS